VGVERFELFERLEHKVIRYNLDRLRKPRKTLVLRYCVGAMYDGT